MKRLIVAFFVVVVAEVYFERVLVKVHEILFLSEFKEFLLFQAFLSFDSQIEAGLLSARRIKVKNQGFFGFILD